MLARRINEHDFDLERSFVPLCLDTSSSSRFKFDQTLVDQQLLVPVPDLDQAEAHLADQTVVTLLSNQVPRLDAFDHVDRHTSSRTGDRSTLQDCQRQQFKLWDAQDVTTATNDSPNHQPDHDIFASESTLPTYSEADIVESLLLSVTGLESPLFAWDSSKDRLVWRVDIKGKQKQGARMQFCSDETTKEWVPPRLTVELRGADQPGCSLVESVLTVGTALVRLDEVALSLVKPQTAKSKLRQSASRRDEKPSKSSHAVAASLTCFVAWARQQLATLDNHSPLPSPLEISEKISTLSSILVSLCNLFSRPASTAPPYHFLPLSTPSLLSHLHHFLQHHLEHSKMPPLLHQAVAAWLLDGALAEWQRGWYHWIGLTDRIGVDWSELGIEVKRKPKKTQDALTEELEDRNSDNDDVDYILHTSKLPNFIPRAAALELFEAGRALRLLRKAAPHHPLCRASNLTGLESGLLWTEVEMVRHEAAISNIMTTLYADINPWLDKHNRSSLQLELSALRKGRQSNSTLPFDLFAADVDTASTWQRRGQVTVLQEFLTARLHATNTASLSILPLSSPLLPALLSRSMFSPLRHYAQLPSTCLLSLLFSDMSLRTHFEVLRSFIFFGNESFSRRVREALFTPPVEDSQTNGKQTSRYGVGMGVYLHEKSVWPPGGSQLGIALRTALKEALEDILHRQKRMGDKSAMVVWESLDSSLSFAFEEASDDDDTKWKDPNSLEALDFLFLNYRVPSPLDLILTSNVMRKYHNIFKHLLRLIRIDCVVNTTWQTVQKPVTNKDDDEGQHFLFEKQPHIRTSLINLMFESRNLIVSLTTYCFDCAVDGNFQTFMRALDKVERVSNNNMRGKTGGVMTNQDDDDNDSDDEFDQTDTNAWNLDSLALVHYEFLSRVEKGLMLKKAQFPLRQLVQGIMLVVMELGRLVNEWKESRDDVDEESVMDQIKAVRTKLRQVTSTLVKVLMALDDRGPISQQTKTSNMTDDVLSQIDMDKGADWVQQLLVRLDGQNRFYSSLQSSTKKSKTAL
ncbi:hypothetical protein OIO90_001935 [Microbotryomycetes sp. JL221]|nr:hypothetical protein OIO90_001935 [Microbotryomycetes sp. JL221]